MSKKEDKRKDIEEQEEQMVDEQSQTAAEDQQENAENVQEQDSQDEEASPLEALQEKYNTLNDKYLRLYSDFENFRKRTQKEKVDLISNAGAGVIKDLLAVVDDFERAIENNDKTEDGSSLKEGFHLIHNKFKKILEQKGVKVMKAKGEPFDYDLHEAVTKIPAPTEDDKGKVIDVIEQGYYLNDKVLRFAKVVVGE